MRGMPFVIQQDKENFDIKFLYVPSKILIPTDIKLKIQIMESSNLVIKIFTI